MKYKLIFLLVLSLSFFRLHGQVSVPDPVFYLAFDTRDIEYESVSKTKGTFTGVINQLWDRFGNQERAVRFLGQGSGIQFTNTSNINSVHTVSFWVQISDPSVIPHGQTPFTSTDRKWMFYNWTKGNGSIMRGVARQKATIGFNRYIQKNTTERVPWYLWGYSPVEFDEYGWYHIFVVQNTYYSRMTMFKPNGEKAIFYHWLGEQDFSNPKKLVVGGFGNYFGSEGAFDDFKVYNAALTDDQVSFLHTAEYPTEEYLRIKNKNSGKYVTVKDISTLNYAPIIQHSGLGVGHNEWKLHEVGNNQYIIRNLHSDKIMVVKDASTAVGAAVIQYTRNGTDNEIWIPEYSILDTKYFRLKNKNSGKYLTIKDDAQVDNAILVQSNPGLSSQYWRFEKSVPIQGNVTIERGLYRLKNKNSGMYLDVYDRSLAKEARITQHSQLANKTSMSQLWFITQGYDNAYYIQNMVSDLYMHAQQNYTALANITQGIESSSSTNLWQIIPTSIEGEYELRNVENYMYAVTLNASKSDDAAIVQYPTGVSDNSIWKLERFYYSDMVIPEGYYEIINSHSLKKMVVENASTADYARIIQYSDGQANSQFEITSGAFGYSTINNLNSKKYLVIQDASYNQGAQLIQYGSTYPTANGNWLIERVYYNMYGTKHFAYSIKNMRSGMRLGVENKSLYNGANIKQYVTADDELSSLWRLEPAAVIQPRSETTSNDEILKMNEIDVRITPNALITTCQSEENTTLYFILCDMSGRILSESSKSIESGNSVTELNISNLGLQRSSVYVLSIHSANEKIKFFRKFTVNAL